MGSTQDGTNIQLFSLKGSLCGVNGSVDFDLEYDIFG